MAFLYNLVKKTAAPNSDETLVWISLSIFLFYLASDPLVNFSFGYNLFDSTVTYLFWAGSNALLILVIIFISKGMGLGSLPAKLYVLVGLSINTTLFIAMYVDMNFAEFIGHWWLWSLYSITVNLMDLMMIIALFTNKDFLGLVRGYRKVSTSLTLKS